MHKRSRRQHAFTLIELLIVIALIALLIAITVPTMAHVKERSRRVVCMGTIRSFHMALITYAADNDELLPKSGFGDPYAYLITMHPQAYKSLEGEFFCPDLINPFRGEPANIFDGGSFQPEHGYNLLAYCYLGAYPDTPWTLTGPDQAEWKSPQKTTENSRLPLLTELNAWIEQYNITFAPHGQSGPIHESGDSTNRSRCGIPSDQIGAAGGNICTLDGAVAWKAMTEMVVHRASSDPASNLLAAW